MDQNYMTPGELRGVAEYCEVLNPLWEALVNENTKGGVYVEAENITLNVYDANGEVLGIITWAAEGPAFYPTVTPDA